VSDAAGGRAIIACVAGPNIELIILEYWNVAEENLDRFLAFYEDTFFRAISNCPGFGGMTVNVRSPRTSEMLLGTPPGPRVAITPHPFMHQLGTRTDAMIDFDALLQYEWNVLGMQLLTTAEHLDTLWDDFVAGFAKVRPHWREEYPEAKEPTDVMIAEFFRFVDNHWDVFVETRRTLWSDALARIVQQPE
jgi:hypothetical protein